MEEGSPSCCVGFMFSTSSPLMLTRTIWVVQLDRPGSRQVTAIQTDPGWDGDADRRARKRGGKAAVKRRYLGWLRPPPPWSRSLPSAPSEPQSLHSPPHRSTLSPRQKTRIKVFKNVKTGGGRWDVMFDLLGTPECNLPKEGETASPSQRSLCGAFASAGQWFRHLGGGREADYRWYYTTQTEEEEEEEKRWWDDHHRLLCWLVSWSSLWSPRLCVVERQEMRINGGGFTQKHISQFSVVTWWSQQGPCTSSSPVSPIFLLRWPATKWKK